MKYQYIPDSYNYNLINEKFGDYDKFFIETFNKVIFEDGDYVFVGVPIDENKVNSKSLIFEFAYDFKSCSSIEQLKAIKEISNNVFKMIEDMLISKIDVQCSYIVNNGMKDAFENREEKYDSFNIIL